MDIVFYYYIIFYRADASIGVLSDDRLNPNLDCKYTLSFDNLSIFLKELLDKDFEFSDNILDNLLDNNQIMTFRLSANQS
jgi:hypothetical protein